MPPHVSRCLLAAAVWLTLIPAAPAGWLSIKNDTDKPVLVQEATTSLLRRGKIVRLLPGEVYREFQLRPGSRKLEVFDAAKPAAAVAETTIKWTLTDTTFKLTWTADPKPDQPAWAVVDAAPPKLPAVVPGRDVIARAQAPVPTVVPVPKR